MKHRVLLGFLGLGLILGGCGLLEEVPLLPPAAAPTNLSASFGTARASVSLEWTAVERATRYEIQRAEAAEGDYAPVGTSLNTSFTDAVGTENQGKWYWYRVRACNAAGCGPWSEAVRGYAGYPPAPEGVDASKGDYPDKIKVWWDPVPGANSYHVFRDTVKDGTYGTKVAEFVPEHLVFDENVRTGTWYYYKIVAGNHWGYSALSQAASGYCGPRPMPFAEDAEPN